MSTIITPPGAPTVIQREKPVNVVLQTDRPKVVVTGGVAPIIPVCNPHPVVVGNPVSKTIELVTKGPQGEQGPEGPPGPAGGNVVQLQAVGVLGGHRVVRSVPGGIGYASANDPAHGDDVVGLTLQAGADEPINVQVAGEVVEPSWDWAPQEPIFLGADGMLTQVPPEEPAAFVLVFGFATSPTSLMIRIEPPIYF